MQWGERPVILAGHGLRRLDMAARLLEMGFPVLSSWQAADLFDNHHPNYYGRPGLYGQRAANSILVEADHVIAVGNRLSIWNVGYEGIKQRLTVVDIDREECFERYPEAELIVCDASDFVESMQRVERRAWLQRCDSFKRPWLEPCHAHGEYLNSYQCIHDIGGRMKPDAVVVTDMGAAICGAFQVLKVKPPQRLLTSGGLGEMGCALPYAIGASFARDKGEVIALMCDGGTMINLQEFQTVKHHKLPIKMFLFDNQGYSMIRHTQKNLGYEYRGVDPASGVSTPDFRKLAFAWDFPAADVRTVAEWDAVLNQVMTAEGPCLAVIHIDPEQRFWPKLEPIVENGKVRSPAFNELTP